MLMFVKLPLQFTLYIYQVLTQMIHSFFFMCNLDKPEVELYSKFLHSLHSALVGNVFDGSRAL